MHELLIQDLEGVAQTTPRLAVLMRRAIQALQGPPDENSIPYEDILASFNRHLGSYLPRAGRLPSGRKAQIRARWNEHADQRNIEWWDTLFTRAAASDFLTGRRAAGGGHENWRPNFDWLVKPANVTKILEGNYDNRGPRENVENITRFR